MKRVWQFLPPLVCIVTIVGFGLLSTIVPWLAMPPDRAFTGMNGYSSDYIQYVSYIKEGMYGRYTMLFRSFPFPQPETPIHFFYIGTGIIARLIGIGAPSAFLLLRVILGSMYVYLTYVLFLRVFKRGTAFLATLLAFVSTPLSWPQLVAGKWELVSLGFFNFDIIYPERATSRPHYLFGAVMFLGILLLLTGRRRIHVANNVALGVLAFLGAMVHSSLGILLFIISCFLFLVEILPDVKKDPLGVFRSRYLFAIGGSAAALGLTYFFIKQYALVPGVQLGWLDSYIYSVSMAPSSIWHDILSFGPTLWLATVGLLWGAFQPSGPHKKVHRLVLVWLLVQYGLFLFGYQLFHADRVRFLQSLYHLPSAYGSALFLQLLAERTRPFILPAGMFLLLLLSLPIYAQRAVGGLYGMTDYNNFGIFEFPTKAQMEAYQFLDRFTPAESIVLADYEAANNILIYSHNFVIGNDQGWSANAGQKMLADRDMFYSGSLSETDARIYLIANHIDYIYYGYQERLGGISRYSFLAPVFQNNEVTIYKFR